MKYVKIIFAGLILFSINFIDAIVRGGGRTGAQPTQQPAVQPIVQQAQPTAQQRAVARARQQPQQAPATQAAPAGQLTMPSSQNILNAAKNIERQKSFVILLKELAQRESDLVVDNNGNFTELFTVWVMSNGIASNLDPAMIQALFEAGLNHYTAINAAYLRSINETIAAKTQLYSNLKAQYIKELSAARGSIISIDKYIDNLVIAALKDIIPFTQKISTEDLANKLESIMVLAQKEFKEEPISNIRQKIYDSITAKIPLDRVYLGQALKIAEATISKKLTSQVQARSTDYKFYLNELVKKDKETLRRHFVSEKLIQAIPILKSIIDDTQKQFPAITRQDIKNALQPSINKEIGLFTATKVIESLGSLLDDEQPQPQKTNIPQKAASKTEEPQQPQTTQKISLKEYNYTSAAVLPFFVIDNETFVILGREASAYNPDVYHTYDDWGGKRDQGETHPLESAAREFFEEAMLEKTVGMNTVKDVRQFIDLDTGNTKNIFGYESSYKDTTTGKVEISRAVTYMTDFSAHYKKWFDNFYIARSLLEGRLSREKNPTEQKRLKSMLEKDRIAKIKWNDLYDALSKTNPGQFVWVNASVLDPATRTFNNEQVKLRRFFGAKLRPLITNHPYEEGINPKIQFYKYGTSPISQVQRVYKDPQSYLKHLIDGTPNLVQDYIINQNEENEEKLTDYFAQIIGKILKDFPGSINQLSDITVFIKQYTKEKFKLSTVSQLLLDKTVDVGKLRAELTALGHISQAQGVYKDPQSYLKHLIDGTPNLVQDYIIKKDKKILYDYLLPIIEKIFKDFPGSINQLSDITAFIKQYIKDKFKLSPDQQLFLNETVTQAGARAVLNS